MKSSDHNIDPGLFSMLESLRAVPERNMQTANRSRDKFLTQVEKTQLPEMKDPFVLLREKIFNNLNHREQPRRYSMKPVLILIIVIIMLFGSVGGVAYAAQDSLPGQPLYTIKMYSEDIQESLSADPADKALLETSFIRRRFLEMDRIEQSGDDVPQQVFDRLDSQLKQVYAISAGLDDPDLVRTLQRFELVLTEGSEIIAPKTQLASRLMHNNTFQQYIEAQHRLVLEGLQDTDAYRKRLRSGRPDEMPAPPKETAGDILQQRDQLREEDQQRDQLRIHQTSAPTEEPTPVGTEEPEPTVAPQLTPQGQPTSQSQQIQQQNQEQEQKQQRNKGDSQQSDGKNDGGGASGGGSGNGGGKP